MSRLVAFGCSLTFGHGLEDCFQPPDQPGLNPSKLGWVSTLAKHMNLPYINNSTPGASNKKIWNSIVNFNFKKDDIVFVLWTFHERTSIIYKDKIKDMGSWTGDTFYYKNIYDNYDAELMSKLFISHANMFLESKNIKVFNLLVKNDRKHLLTLGGTTVDHIPIYIENLRQLYPCAADSMHPGIECNQVFSKKILDFLEIKNNIMYHKPFTLVQRIKIAIKEFKNKK